MTAWLRGAVLALVLMWIAPVCASTLPSDPLLDKPVTVSMKGKELPTLLSALTEQTGASLKASKEISGQKVTVFVDAKPLRDVMLGIENLFGFRWVFEERNGRRTYELYMPEKLRVEKREAVDGTLDAAWKDIWSQITDAANSETDQSTCRALAARICALPSVAIDAIRSGDTVVLNLESPDAAWAIPRDTAEQLVERGLDGTAQPEAKVYLTEATARIKPTADMRHPAIDVLMEACYSMPEINRGGSAQQSHVWSPRQSLLPPFPGSNHLSVSGTDTRLALPLTFDKESVAKEVGALQQDGGARAERVNRSDVLALAHRQLGLQVIADHYTVFDSLRALGPTARQALDDARWGSSWATDGEFLYMRRNDAWWRDRSEIPSETIERFETAFAQHGRLGLSERAALALLTREQREGLIADDHGDCRGLYWADVKVCEENLAGLRLYGLLSDAQRELAAKDGVPVSELTRDQLREARMLCRGAYREPYGILSTEYRTWIVPADATAIPGSARIVLREESSERCAGDSYYDDMGRNCVECFEITTSSVAGERAATAKPMVTTLSIIDHGADIATAPIGKTIVIPITITPPDGCCLGVFTPPNP